MARLRELKVPPGFTVDPMGTGRHRPDSEAIATSSVVGQATRPKEERAVPEAVALHQLGWAEVWNHVQKLALQQLDRLVAMEPKVLRDASPKPVHDLRVASRRLQSLLDFLYTPPPPPQVQKQRRRLRRARRVLGSLRNQDVMAARIERILARKRATHRQAWETVQGYVLKLRPKIAARAHRKLTRLNLGEIYIRLREELAGSSRFPARTLHVVTFPEQSVTHETPGARAEEVSQSETEVETTPAARFAERLSDLWQDFELRSSDSRRDPNTLHALRIAAKRLRYTIEVAADLRVSGSTEALDWLRELQGKLGKWHDAEVLGHTMIELVARQEFLEEHLPLAIEIERLVLRLRSSKTRSCIAYLRAAFKSPNYRRTADWITQWTGLQQPVG